MATLREYLYTQKKGTPQKTKRNFLKENVKQVKVIEAQRHWEDRQGLTKNGIKLQPIHKKLTAVGPVKKRANVWDENTPSVVSKYLPKKAGAVSSDDATSLQTDATPPTMVSLSVCEGAELTKKHVKVKNKGVQTIGQGEDINAKGIVKYASKGMDQKPEASHPGADGDCNILKIEDQPKESPVSKKDFVRLNALTLGKSKQVPHNKNIEKLDPIKAPANYQKGTIPKYLRNKKEANTIQDNTKKEYSSKPVAKKLEEASSNQEDPDCPPGHIVIPENDRKEHLRILRQNYADLINELNSLPVSSNSAKIYNRKQEIEKQLDLMEAGIKLFSREKLFVKVVP